MSSPMIRPAERGLTLIELLVALAVFSVAALALLNVAGENVRAAAALERRAFAQTIAENQLVEAMLIDLEAGAEVVRGEAELAGLRFRWARQITPTADPRLVRVDIAVREADEDQVLATLQAFREP